MYFYHKPLFIPFKSITPRGLGALENSSLLSDRTNAVGCDSEENHVAHDENQYGCKEVYQVTQPICIVQTN